MELSIEAQGRMRKILDWLERMRQLRAADTGLMAQFGELDHEIAYLALDVSAMERITARAMAESKPETKDKEDGRG